MSEKKEDSIPISLEVFIDSQFSGKSLGVIRRQEEIALLEKQLPALESMPEVAKLVAAKISALQVEIKTIEDIPDTIRRQTALSDLFSTLPENFFGENITSLIFTKTEGNGWILQTRKAKAKDENIRTWF